MFEPLPPPVLEPEPVFELDPEDPEVDELDPVEPDVEELLELVLEPVDVDPVDEVGVVVALTVFVTIAPVGVRACQIPPTPWPLTSPGLESPE